MTEPSSEPKNSKLRHPIVVGLIVTVVGGLALSWAIGLIGPKSGGASTGVEGGGEAEPRATENARTERGPVTGTESTVVEWSDNHAGSPVFADPRGNPVEGKPSRISYGTEVVVSCFAPDESGMQSVSGFYRIASGEWQGDYVVADTMTNGGPVGNTDTPNVDPRVRKC